jgi:hypothetical protein
MPKKLDMCVEKVKSEYGFDVNPYAVCTKSMSSEILFPKEQEMYSRLRFKEHYSKEKALKKINEYRKTIGRVMLDLSKFI